MIPNHEFLRIQLTGILLSLKHKKPLLNKKKYPILPLPPHSNEAAWRKVSASEEIHRVLTVSERCYNVSYLLTENRSYLAEYCIEQ